MKHQKILSFEIRDSEFYGGYLEDEEMQIKGRQLAFEKNHKPVRQSAVRLVAFY